MLIYIANFILNMLLGVLILGKHPSMALSTRKKTYLILTTIQLSFFCGSRATSVGYDTISYEWIFLMCPNTLEELFSYSSAFIEPGFYLFCSIIKIAGGNLHTMLILASFFTIGSCCVFLYRHSGNVLYSVFILICFPFYYSSFDLVRYFIAIAFFLLAYKYIEEKKPVKYILLLLIGSTFHTTGILFVFFYFIRYLKWNIHTICGIVIATLFCFFFIEDVAILISKILSRYGGYANSQWIGSYGGGVKTAIMYFALLLISSIGYSNLKKKCVRDAYAAYYMLFMFCFAFVFINARMMTRLIMSTTSLLAIAIPTLLNRKRTKNVSDNLWLNMCTIAIGLIYHIFMLTTNWQHVVPYVPFWK